MPAYPKLRRLACAAALMKSRAMVLGLATAAALLCGQGFAQAPTAVRIRGEIEGVDASTVTVHRLDGATVKIAIKPDLVVSALKNMALADIKPGSFIGTATKTTADGKLVALEIFLFPDSARGTGEGHYPWDLAPGSMMTNANVDTVVEGVDGRNMRLSYKGGTKEVIVPAGVPVVTPVPATRADLVVGKRVFMFASGDPSSLSAARITVEKDGVVPPM